MEFKLPELGENIQEAQVLKVLVSVGDTVQAEQGIIEVESDKANLEVPAPAAGSIKKLHVSKGDTIKVGQAIATIQESGGQEDSDRGEKTKTTERDEGKPRDESEAPEESEEQPSPEKPQAQTKEREQEKPEQEEPEQEEPEEDKTPKDQTKDQGEKEARDAKAPAAEQTPEPGDSGPPSPAFPRVPVFAAPSVRQFARQIGIAIDQVPGTGPGGRIAIDDVKRFAREQRATAQTPSGPGRIQAGPLPDFSQWGEVDYEALSTVRRKTATHMALCWSTVPHVTLFEKADATELEAQRQRFKDRAKDAGGQLSITAMLLRIVAAALRVHPKLAASIDMGAQRIATKHYCHVGVAVDTPRGLMVPVIRDVDQKSMIELSVELGKIAAKAREGKLTMDAISGGVFTLTNLGGLGTGFFTPIVNHPEAAILGVGRAATEPVFNEAKGQFVPRLLMPLSLSFDHRLIDGADGARFLHWVAEAIRNPILLVLEGRGKG